MLCTKCGNKLPSGSTTCKFCGYQMTTDDNDEVANIIDVKPVFEKTNTVSKKTFRVLDVFFIILSINLIAMPFVMIPLAAIEYSLTVMFFVCSIISVFIELLGIYLINHITVNKKALRKISTIGIYIGILTMMFSLTFIISLYVIKDLDTLNTFKDYLASIIGISIASLIYGIVTKLLIKYS